MHLTMHYTDVRLTLLTVGQINANK